MASTVDVAAIPDRVAAGAAWLDRHLVDWWHRIDLDRLDLGSECRCVLGQLGGDYNVALEALNLADPEALGFDAVWQEYEDAGAELYRRNAEYAALTAEWSRVIAARRAQAGT